MKHGEGSVAPKMRAKVVINHIDNRHEGYETLYMNPVAKNGYDASGLDENNTYAKFSPGGQFSLTIANPALLGQFKRGEEYYVDFTLATPAPAAE